MFGAGWLSKSRVYKALAFKNNELQASSNACGTLVQVKQFNENPRLLPRKCALGRAWGPMPYFLTSILELMKYLWVVFALGCAWPLVASAQEGTAGRTPCDSLGMLSIALSGERCTDSVLTFSAAGLPGLQQYEWNLGDGENFSTAELQRAYPQPGLYSAVLIAIDEAGCVFSANISFEVAFCGPAGGCQYNFPNAFTPNGDGLNDTFGLLSSCPPEGYRLQVFDRWGEKVFESGNVEQAWDGRCRNRPAPAAVYFYRAAVQSPEGQGLQLKGSVTLVR